MQVGWGAICGGHLNHGDRHGAQCKKALMFSGRSGMTSDEARVRVKQWLLEGLLIDEADRWARRTHVAINPRSFALMDEDRVDRLAP